MELKDLLRALADGKGKLKITGFPKDHIINIKDLSARKMSTMIENFDCISLYEEPELTPQDICGYVWENKDSGNTEMFVYNKIHDHYIGLTNCGGGMQAGYTAKDIEEQFTRWKTIGEKQ